MKHLYFKPNSISQLLVILLVVFTSVCLGQDVRRQSVAAVTALAISSDNDPEGTDELFVNGSDNDFDQYLFRADVPNGRLAFDVDISRYYSNLMQFDANGFLTNAQDLVQRNLIPKTVRLTLRVFDVDHDAQVDINGDGIADPEVDYVYINGKQITTGNGSPWKLSSGNDTWSTPSINIPIEYLKFPTQPGTATTKPNAQNVIQIEVDATNTGGWAIECDWISISIENKIRPIVLVRGFGASSGGSTVGTADETWQVFGNFLRGDGIPFFIAQSIDPCGGIIENGINLGAEVEGVLNIFGVDKVNLVGHSKGGLDARAYLRTSRLVENLIQLGSPNHGSGLAYFSALCQPAGDQLQPNWLADNFNYLNRNIAEPIYVDELASGTKVYHIVGSRDWIVSLQRATLPWRAVYTSGDLTEPDNIVNNGQFPLGHGALRESQAVYQRAIQLIAPGIQTSSGARTQNVISQNASEIETDSLALISSNEDILLATFTRTRQIYIPIGGLAIFQVLFENPLAEFDLQSPSGKIYNSSSPEYSKEQIFGGLITYEIQNAENGNWLVIMKGGDKNGFASLQVRARSDKSLLTSTGGKSRFGLGEPVPVTATFLQGTLPVLNAGVILYYKQTSKTDSIQLFDDGLHNDKQANDGIYGNQVLGFQNAGTTSLIFKAEIGPESIYIKGNITVLPSSAEFTNSYKENALDVNSDGYYDSLQIKVGINIKQTGHFMVTAVLRDSRDSIITSASWSTTQSGSLSAGAYEVPLNFSGKEIGRNGLNGPYKLDNLVLTDLKYSVPLFYLNNPYSTKSYSINQFPRPPIELTGSNSETPVDSDGDGDYDFLDIKVQLKVNVAGTYSISAELIDSLQNDLNWTTTNLNLKEGLNEIILRFSGQEINEKLSNGPYILTNLNLFNVNSIADITFYDVHKTAQYKFSEFTGNIVSGVVKDRISGLPVIEAEVILSGSKLANVKTDSTGHFAIAGLPNGSYNLRIRKSNYCDATTINVALPANQNILELTLIPQKITISDKDSLQIVDGDALTLAAPTGWEVYNWSTGETTNSIIVRKAGEYYLRTSLDNCQAFSDTVIVTVQAGNCPSNLEVVATSCSERTTISWTEPRDAFPGVVAIPEVLDPGKGTLILMDTLNGHGYYMSNNFYQWPVARDIARLLGGTGVNGHLATLTNAEENQFIFNQLKGTNAAPWIGLFNTGRPGRFRWVGNEDFDYTNWATGEPSNAGGNANNVAEPYVHILGNYGTWNDASNISFPFIAEFEKPLIRYKQISGPRNGSKQKIGVYLIGYEKTNLITDKKDTCYFSVTITCNTNATTGNNNSISSTIQRREVSEHNVLGLNVKVYPNPSNTHFVVNIASDNNKERINMQVLNGAGKIIEQKNGLTPNQNLEIGSTFSAGIYFIQITQGSKRTSLKLIKL